MKAYQDKVEIYSELYHKTNKKYNSISLLRLLSIFLLLFFMFNYIKTDKILYVILAVLSFAGFIFLMKIHSRLSFQKLLADTLLKINRNEIAFLKREKTSFENGAEFIDFHHPYAYDLDIFGEHSLFQSLNRTATFIGKKSLANLLLHTLPQSEILENQEAINELKDKLEWRQEFQALGIISQDSKESYEAIKYWSSFKNNSLPKVLNALSFILPTLFFAFLTAYFVTSKTIILSYLTYIFIANLIVLGRAIKRIQSEIAKADNVDKIIKQYSLLIEKIENESFQSKKLIDLQKQLVFKSNKASQHLKQLSELFSRMDTISNFVTATLFNGTFLFNLHVLKALLKWKENYSSEIDHWISIIGEIET